MDVRKYAVSAGIEDQTVELIMYNYNDPSSLSTAYIVIAPLPVSFDYTLLQE